MRPIARYPLRHGISCGTHGIPLGRFGTIEPGAYGGGPARGIASFMELHGTAYERDSALGLKQVRARSHRVRCTGMAPL